MKAFSFLLAVLFRCKKPSEIWLDSDPESMSTLADMSAVFAFYIIRLLVASLNGSMYEVS